MTKFTKITLSALFAIGLVAPAFAMDQVVLTNGQIIEGKVLNDVPNRYVDIETLNGLKQRFQHAEVASVERDVPSNKENSMLGNDSQIYFGALGGLSIAQFSSNSSTVSPTTYTQVNYGARFGVNALQIGDFSKLAFGLSFDRFSESDSKFPNISESFTSFQVQALFRKVANSGFYFGPEIGLALVTYNNSNGIINTTTKVSTTSVNGTGLTGGAVAGYDFFFTPTFSFGPEVHLDSVAALNGDIVENRMTVFKFFLNLTLSY